MSGVNKGDERAVAEADVVGDGNIAGNILGEQITVDVELDLFDCMYPATSDDERWRGKLPLPVSMCVVDGIFWRFAGSWLLLVRLRLRRMRCSSRMNPMNKFRNTHFPIFTKMYLRQLAKQNIAINLHLSSSLNRRSGPNPASSA